MAKQAGPLYFTGTIGDLIFYKLGDNYYVRQKGSYNTKAVQTPGARPLMQLKQGEFGQASKLASEVYRMLPKAMRGHGVHGRLTARVLERLRKGLTAEEIKTLLLQELQPTPPTSLPKQPALLNTPPAQKSSASNLSEWQVQEKGRLVHPNTENKQPMHFLKKPHEAANYCSTCYLSPTLRL